MILSSFSVECFFWRPSKHLCSKQQSPQWKRGLRLRRSKIVSNQRKPSTPWDRDLGGWRLVRDGLLGELAVSVWGPLGKKEDRYKEGIFFWELFSPKMNPRWLWGINLLIGYYFTICPVNCKERWQRTYWSLWEPSRWCHAAAIPPWGASWWHGWDSHQPHLQSPVLGGACSAWVVSLQLQQLRFASPENFLQGGSIFWFWWHQ